MSIYSEKDQIALIKKVIEVAEEKAATDFAVIKVAEISDITDFFVLMSCNNERQLKALTIDIEKQLKNAVDRNLNRKEAAFESHWCVLDYGDFIIHIFLGEIRADYDLEELWSKGERLNIDDFLSS